MITFIVPTLGRDSLKPALESLLAQENPNWKAIVIFDGIPEQKVVEDERISYIAVSKLGGFGYNGNGGAVRNFGLTLVKSGWVGFLDDDDQLYANYVDALEFEKEHCPEAELILFRMYRHPYFIPQPGLNDIVPNQAGISFAVNMDAVNKYNLQFMNHDYEDFMFLDHARQKGVPIRISTICTYHVRPQ